MVIPPLITLLQSTHSFLPSNRLLSACSYDRSGIKQVAPLRAINRLLDSKVHTDSAEKVSMRRLERDYNRTQILNGYSKVKVHCALGFITYSSNPNSS